MNAGIVTRLVWALVSVSASISSAGPTTAPVDLTGLWLVDQSPTRPEVIMRTTVRIEGRKFTLHGFWGFKADWTGTFDLADDGQPTHFALNSDGISWKERGLSGGYPPCRLLGLFALDGDRLTFCYGSKEADGRPAEIKAADHASVASFVRAPAGWSGFPRTVKVNVLDPSGRPDPAAELFGYMYHERPSFERAGKYYIDTTQPARLSTISGLKDDDGGLRPDGTIVVPYDRFADQTMPMGARDVDHKWVGVTRVSPAVIKDGVLTIRMQPERIVRGTIGVDGEQAPGQRPPWRAAYLTAFQDRFAYCDAGDGNFEFTVPPGTYSLYTYGNDLIDQTREIVVPTGDGDFQVPAVSLKSAKILSLLGKSAPELVDVKAWKNGPVSLADLKGKVVLIDFWGYWCGNCVVDMPQVMRLYDKYKDKGLAVVSVHVDDGGEVDTVEKLDAKTKMYRDGIWKGRDLPFPVAICSGKDRRTTGNPGRYGVQYYPTVIVIDRGGNVLGAARTQVPLDLDDPKAADAEIEKLLAKP